MKTKIFAAFAAAAILLGFSACVSTVTDQHTPGVPLLKDSFANRYERTVDQAFEAAKAVIGNSGVLNSESILHNQTNLVKTIEGKVNQRNVYVRVQSVTPTVSHIIVQARHPAGAPDMTLAHQLEKEVALALVGTR